MTQAVAPAPEHLRERALRIGESPELHKPKLILSGHVRGTSIMDNFASHDMPGRQGHIQDCVDQILAKVSAAPEAG